MSAVTRRRGTRRGSRSSGAGARSRRQPAVELELSDSDVENTDPTERDTEGGCIDLTQEDDDVIYEQQVVDLTSPMQSTHITSNDTEPIMITGISEAPTRRRGAGRRRRGRTSQSDSPRRQRRRDTTSLWDSESDSEELPDIKLPGTPYTPQPSTSATDAASPLSPEGVPLSCPICMDSANRIKASGRQLHSTICGHIFCNECLKNCLKAQKRCPTCRKKLTEKQTHQIFL